MSRSRYLRPHRSERYLKGMHSAEDTANFPNPSTVGPHEFCRRSCERDTVAKLEIKIIICKFRDHIKEFTYTYLIHRNRTYRTQFNANRNTTAPFALLSRHLNQLVAAVLHDHDFDCKLYSPSLVVDHLIRRRLTSLRIYMTIS